MTLVVSYPTRVVLPAAFLLAGALNAQSRQPAPATPKATAVFANGMAQVVPAFQDSAQWIRQNLWVETDFDSDKDGRKDRVHVDVTRPAQTETEGLRVPVVYGSSPYFAGTARPLVMWDVKQELGTESPPRGQMAAPPYRADRTRISNALVGTWVPRGFAVVHSEASGTGRSQGCPTVGDHPERMAMKFVIDWLNGRAKGFTTPNGPDEVQATSWSTGNVGMMGTSYEGTLPLAAATTGVKGLEVVIPVAPNTSYYHYYRANGLVRSPGGYLGEDVDVLYDFVASGDTAGRPNCDRLWKNGVFAGSKSQDRATGDFNDFWEARDLLPHVKNIRAAVLLAHGLNDYNVTPSHSVRIYEEMRARGLPASIYLHQGGHGGPPPADMVNRWFSHYLYGVANGVETDPPAWIVPRAGTPPSPFPSFPVPGSVPVALHPTAGGTGIAGLSLTPPAEAADTLVDDVAMSGSANASAARSSNRLLYATATLTDTVHISGTVRVTLHIASSKPAANLSVWLVTLPYDSARLGSQGHVGVVTRGWADIQNYKSLTKGGNYASKRAGEALVPGKFYDLTFDLEPDDQMIAAGQQLAVMVMSSDREFTLWPQAGTQLTVDLARSSFALPIVGGVTALTKAGAFAQSASDTRFDALAALAEAKMKEYGVPGLALGVVRDGVVSIRGLGVTNLEDPLPVTAHTVFPIASISKTFAATAMMRLVEQGKVDLRAPVRTYLPEFRVRDEAVSRDVTVWHLLTHLGGWEGQVSGPDRGTETLKNFVGSITDLMQVAPPGAAWSYNNAGFSIAGHVIEAVTGTSINRAIRDLVFQPLGLEHAGTTAGDFIVQRFASGHSTRNGVATLMRPFAPSVSVTAGGVGLCMTDLLAYARFHMGDGTAANGERVLKRESLERLRTPQQRKQSTDDDIGIGWHLRSVGALRTASHGGTLGGHILLLEIVPERNFAIAILTNSSAGWRVIQDVEREALKSYLGATYAPNQAIAHRGLVETLPSVQPLARQPDLAPYVGTYARPSNTVAVRADGARLLIQNRPNNGQPGAEMPISFFGPDRAIVTEGSDTGQSIEFVRDSSGRVNWIRVVGRVAVRTQ